MSTDIDKAVQQASEDLWGLEDITSKGADEADGIAALLERDGNRIGADMLRAQAARWRGVNRGLSLFHDQAAAIAKGAGLAVPDGPSNPSIRSGGSK